MSFIGLVSYIIFRGWAPDTLETVECEHFGKLDLYDDLWYVLKTLLIGWIPFPTSTECITNLDERSERIIFVSMLTTFVSFFQAAGAVAKIGSSLKPDHHIKFSLPKSVKPSVQTF